MCRLFFGELPIANSSGGCPEARKTVLKIDSPFKQHNGLRWWVNVIAFFQLVSFMPRSSGISFVFLFKDAKCSRLKAQTEPIGACVPRYTNRSNAHYVQMGSRIQIYHVWSGNNSGGERWCFLGMHGRKKHRGTVFKKKNLSALKCQTAWWLETSDNSKQNWSRFLQRKQILSQVPLSQYIVSKHNLQVEIVRYSQSERNMQPPS